MEVKASLKHLRTSAQKVRLVIDLVRGLPVAEASDQLRFNKKLAAAPVAKLLKSAVANAVNTYDLEADNLLIKEIRADEGVTLKRWMPRAHGRATTIRKRACHINIVLSEIKDSGKKEKKTVKIEEPVKLDKLVKDGEKMAKPKASKKEDKAEKVEKAEQGKEIIDPRMEGRHPHAKVEGGKGFSAKMFRRKSG